MAQFTANAQRFDPYKNFRFRVKWDGKYVAGIDQVTPFAGHTEVVNIAKSETPAPLANRRAVPSTTPLPCNAASPTTLNLSSGRRVRG
jgi:hypothetical protein